MWELLVYRRRYIKKWKGGDGYVMDLYGQVGKGYRVQGTLTLLCAERAFCRPCVRRWPSPFSWSKSEGRAHYCEETTAVPFWTSLQPIRVGQAPTLSVLSSSALIPEFQYCSNYYKVYHYFITIFARV